MWFADGPNPVLPGVEEPCSVLRSEQGLGEVLAQREEDRGKEKELEFVTFSGLPTARGKSGQMLQGAFL